MLLCVWTKIPFTWCFPKIQNTVSYTNSRVVSGTDEYIVRIQRKRRLSWTFEPWWLQCRICGSDIVHHFLAGWWSWRAIQAPETGTKFTRFDFKKSRNFLVWIFMTSQLREIKWFLCDVIKTWEKVEKFTFLPPFFSNNLGENPHR